MRRPKTATRLDYSVMLINLPTDLVGERVCWCCVRKVGEAMRKLEHWVRVIVEE